MSENELTVPETATEAATETPPAEAKPLSKCQEARRDAEEADELHAWKSAGDAWGRVRNLTKDKEERAHAKERQENAMRMQEKERAESQSAKAPKKPKLEVVKDPPAKKEPKPKKEKPAKAEKPKKEPKPKKEKPAKAFTHDPRIEVGRTYEKEYDGKTYRVKAVADGFKRLDEESPKAEGRLFKSLSSAAEFIAKKAASGYIFFGIENATTKPVTAEQLAEDYAHAAEAWNACCPAAKSIPSTLDAVRSADRLDEAGLVLKRLSVALRRAARSVRRRAE